VIGWKRSGKEKKGHGKLSLEPNLLSFMPRWSPVYFFFTPVFRDLVPYLTKQGFRCRPVPSGAVFIWLYG
jgi:hypothetical protein